MTRTIVRNPFQVEVSFTTQEQSLLASLAEKRQAPKDANRSAVTDKRILQRDNVQTHLIGLMGEYAVAKLIGEEMDAKAYLSGDLLKDFQICGITIEVKTLQGYLAFRSLDELKADVAVLVIHDKSDMSKVSVQGWIDRADFREKHFKDDFGYGERPCMQPSQLAAISSLKGYCINTRNFRWLWKKFNAFEGLVPAAGSAAQPVQLGGQK